MPRPVRRPRLAPALALVALVLLTWAGVRSTVMQAAMAAPAAALACADMGDMAPPAGRATVAAPGKAASGKSTHGSAAACPWCAAAAHAPLHAAGPRPRPPVHAVAFAAYAAPRDSGPRGPPPRRPSARDPPPLSA